LNAPSYLAHLLTQTSRVISAFRKATIVVDSHHSSRLLGRAVTLEKTSSLWSSRHVITVNNEMETSDVILGAVHVLKLGCMCFSGNNNNTAINQQQSSGTTRTL